MKERSVGRAAKIDISLVPNLWSRSTSTSKVLHSIPTSGSPYLFLGSMRSMGICFLYSK